MKRHSITMTINSLAFAAGRECSAGATAQTMPRNDCEVELEASDKSSLKPRYEARVTKADQGLASSRFTPAKRANLLSINNLDAQDP